MATKTLLNTKRVDVIDKKECRIGISIKHIDCADILSPNNISEPLEITCLDLVG